MSLCASRSSSVLKFVSHSRQLWFRFPAAATSSSWNLRMCFASLATRSPQIVHSPRSEEGLGEGSSELFLGSCSASSSPCCFLTCILSWWEYLNSLGHCWQL